MPLNSVLREKGFLFVCLLDIFVWGGSQLVVFKDSLDSVLVGGGGSLLAVLKVLCSQGLNPKKADFRTDQTYCREIILGKS